jgi:1-acyl-sn-glycerol-3-phosphate acyltransferase
MSYGEALSSGQRIYGATRIGRPGRGWAYWPLFVLAQLLRFRWSIRVRGRGNVSRGAAILIGNHVSALDPVIVGLANPWRLSFFTKIEVYEGRGGVFFRTTGQIPLRRGDESATAWALDMSRHVLERGNKLCVYPEGTRSPDGVSLHRLHRRVLIPVLQSNPRVPVHVMSIAYPPTGRWRQPVDLRFSPPLSLDLDAMSDQEITDAVRDALLELGAMPYVDAFGQRVKAREGRT